MSARLAFPMLVRGALDEAAARVREALGRTDELDPQIPGTNVLVGGATVHRLKGALADALPLLREALRCVEGTGRADPIAYCRGQLGSLLADLGELEEAADHTSSTEAYYRDKQDTIGVAFATVCALHLRRARGESLSDLERDTSKIEAEYVGRTELSLPLRVFRYAG